MALPPADWPHRAASRALTVAGLDWHVQRLGKPGAPLVLLLHGSGASTHSWADVVTELGNAADLVVPDVPGHGFTRGAESDRLRLPRVAQDLRSLFDALGLGTPALIVGHSAGAALGLQWLADVPGRRPALLGFNPSLVAPPEFYLRFMAPLINPIATASPVASLLSSIASATGLVDRLLDGTASAIPPAQRQRYRTLFADPVHVRGTLGFMAAADLPALLARCEAGGVADATIELVTGSRDAWVPDRALRPVLARALPKVQTENWRGGHLLHEEDAARAAARIVRSLGKA